MRHRPYVRTLRLEAFEDRCLPSTASLIAFGADAGGGPHVRVVDGDTGAEVRSFFAYDATFTGGVRVAVGDLNSDGIADVVTAAGGGGGPHVKAFDGRTGTVLASFFAYDASFRGGVNVAVGDVTGDGKPDIVTASGVGASPQVRVFDTAGNLKSSFLAYDAAFGGGVSVAVGDINGDATCDIITGAGAGGGPHVKAFAGGANIGSTVLASFFAYAPTFTGGVSVAVGDFDGDDRMEMITGAGPGGGPHVKVIGGDGITVRASFFALNPTFTGGVRVAGTDVNGDEHDDLVASAGPGGVPDCRIFDGVKFQQVAETNAFGANFTGGVWVGGTVTHPIAEANRDAVLDWNAILLSAIATDRSGPPQASRFMAMVQGAVFNAVNAIVPLHESYNANLGLHPNADVSTAVSAAAHDVLASLFPAQGSTFDAALQRWLDKVPDGAPKIEGFALGRQAATAMLALRANDGSAATSSYVPGTAPGEWQPTPPAFAPALAAQWAGVTPWVMNSGSQFRPVDPQPALTSDAYTQAFNQVKVIGDVNSTTRTPDQTEIARFWADAAGTFTPPGHWNEIAGNVSLREGLSPVENAWLMAVLGFTLADAAIASWDTKFETNFWRPVTAIRAADTDGNPNTVADSTWTPLITTPPFPALTSGHSTFSGAASTVLAGYFGENFAFSDRGSTTQPATRSFTSFAQAADEAGMSRIYGGIHWIFDNTSGLSAGRALGQFVADSLLN